MTIYIHKNGEQTGPFLLETVNAGLASGIYSPEDLAWYEGAADWMPLSAVPGIHTIIPIASSVATFAPPPMPPTMIPAGRINRLMAVLLDLLLLILLLVPGGIVFAMGGAIKTNQLTTANYAGGALMLAGLLMRAVFNIYFLCTRGQTIGKMIMRIKIVRFQDGSNPGFVHAYLLRSFVPAILALVPLMGKLFRLADYCLIFSDDRRCIHDHIASTKVVDA